MPIEDEETVWSSFDENLPTFRFAFMIILGLGLTGINITVLKSYKINYPFIFELDPAYKITNI